MSLGPKSTANLLSTWQAILQRRHGGIVEVSLVEDDGLATHKTRWRTLDVDALVDGIGVPLEETTGQEGNS